MEKLDLLYGEMIRFDAGDTRRIQHFIKVHSLARFIGLGEGLSEEELLILEAAALVHDIGIKPAEKKYGTSNGKLQEQEGPPEAETMLTALGFDEKTVGRVCYLVGHHHTYDQIDGADYQILVEADFLVNLHEGNAPREKILHTKETIFKTETGRRVLDAMFGL